MQPPVRLSKNSPLASWLNQLRDFAVSIAPIKGPNKLTDRTTRGSIERPTARPASGAGGFESTPLGMYFRGEHASDQSYSTQDVVVVRTGVTAGTYVAVQPVPAGDEAPGTGNKWVLLAKGVRDEWR